MASSCDKPLCDGSITQITKHAPRRSSLLLKDYLRDDLSSCSSSGFKSLPRRQCCTTVGFLMEKDLQLQRKRRNTIPRRPISVLQKAFNAIKSLPLSQKSAKAKKAATGLLSRSISRKLLSRSFWRKEGREGEARCRRSFRELLMQERDKTTSMNEDNISTAPPSITSNSSGSGSFSWGESQFTFSSSTITSSDTSNENDLVEGPKEAASPHKIEGVTARDWPNEKEQLSPVSVLGCPFEDEEEINSQFSSTIEGAEHKQMQKRRHFKSLASLEPVVLEKRIALSEQEDEPHNNHHSTKECEPIMCTQNVNYDNIEENARDLLNFVIGSIPFNCLDLIIKTENLLFDYFKQSIEENNDIDHHAKKLQHCKVAENWIRGQPQEMYLGWEVQEGRGVYISEMEKCGEWKNSDQEIQQLAMELENEVFTSLVNEIVLDITMC